MLALILGSLSASLTGPHSGCNINFHVVHRRNNSRYLAALSLEMTGSLIQRVSSRADGTALPANIGPGTFRDISWWSSDKSGLIIATASGKGRAAASSTMVLR